MVLERLSDISAVCSHCCLMVSDHVTCMFDADEDINTLATIIPSIEILGPIT
jgi:hypothetical protein